MKSVTSERPASEWRGLKFMGSADTADLWRNSGSMYRLGKAMLVVALIPACAAGALVAVVLTNTSTGSFLDWGIAISMAVSVVLILVGNYVRVGAIKKYRNRTT
jgi:hypothetical protein